MLYSLLMSRREQQNIIKRVIFISVVFKKQNKGTTKLCSSLYSFVVSWYNSNDYKSNDTHSCYFFGILIICFYVSFVEKRIELLTVQMRQIEINT